jgi:hypothetical protein
MPWAFYACVGANFNELVGKGEKRPVRATGWVATAFAGSANAENLLEVMA